MHAAKAVRDLHVSLSKKNWVYVLTRRGLPPTASNSSTYQQVSMESSNQGNNARAWVMSSLSVKTVCHHRLNGGPDHSWCTPKTACFEDMSWASHQPRRRISLIFASCFSSGFLVLFSCILLLYLHIIILLDSFVNGVSEEEYTQWNQSTASKSICLDFTTAVSHHETKWKSSIRQNPSEPNVFLICSVFRAIMYHTFNGFRV